MIALWNIGTNLEVVLLAVVAWLFFAVRLWNQ